MLGTTRESNSHEEGSMSGDSVENLPFLSQASFVGNGFDISGTYAIPDSLILPVVDPDKAGRKTFDFLGVTYSVPGFVLPALDTTGRLIEDVGETREEIQNSFAATASVALGYGAFSGEMEASYGHEYATSSDYSYAYRNYYSRLAVLSLLQDEAQAALSDSFVQAYEALPGEVTAATLPKFEAFFHDFGMYVTSRVSLGASLEYYSAVRKTSQLSTTEISANVKAEYRGLFAAGTFSATITDTESWKAYTANRTVSLAVSGGDPTLVAQLSNIDPSTASEDTCNLFTEWSQSITEAPAIADFALDGIWELIPDSTKRTLVADAFAQLQSALRPRIVVETTSEPDSKPTITIGAVISPDSEPEHPCGFQMVVLDRSDISPKGVLLDKYYGIPRGTGWYDDYKYVDLMYDAMADDLENGAFDDSRSHVIILASYGWSTNAPPNAKMYAILRAAGGGDDLASWYQTADPGSNMWRLPGSYILVGIPALGPGTGGELIKYDYDSGYAAVSLDVFFYRQRGTKLYTLSPGARKGVPEDADDVRRDYLAAGPEQAYVEAVVA
jgi:hypothetical protein